MPFDLSKSTSAPSHHENEGSKHDEFHEIDFERLLLVGSRVSARGPRFRAVGSNGMAVENGWEIRVLARSVSKTSRIA